jgi:photosystem II stability/assembly factor-like uncharacterized protein
VRDRPGFGSAEKTVFRSADTGRTRWTTPLPKPNDGGALWNDLVFNTSRVGWVVYGPVNFSDLGVVYRTANGGRSWHTFGFAGRS